MTKQKLSEDLIKFVCPLSLKETLQQLAQARGVSLSALVRIILSEYVRNKG